MLIIFYCYSPLYSICKLAEETAINLFSKCTTIKQYIWTQIPLFVNYLILPNILPVSAKIIVSLKDLMISKI